MTPSGTKKEILDLLKRSGILSVDQVTDSVGLAKTTLREHFLQLERDEYIKRTYERSGPGRPSLMYSLTSKGHRIYPTREPFLLKSFISFLKKRGEESTIEEFFHTFWEDRLSKAERKLGEVEDDKEEQLQRLADLLSEEGFMPEIEYSEESGTVVVKECNCPFHEVVKETRLPCELEAKFYEKLFKGDVERISYIPEGDYSCTYCITQPEQQTR